MKAKYERNNGSLESAETEAVCCETEFIDKVIRKKSGW